MDIHQARARTTTPLVLSLAFSLIAGLAAAQGKSDERGHGKGADKSQGAHGREADKHDDFNRTDTVVIFQSDDRVVFRDYFATHQINAQGLPPGIAKNLARGKPLPPGIAKRALPTHLLTRQPALADDLTIAVVGDVVVAMQRGVVVDILNGVFN